MPDGIRRWRHAAQLASWGVCLLAPAIWWCAQLADSKATRGVNFFNYDQYHYTVPAFRFAAAELRHGRLPLWVSQQLCGGPFLATQLHGILYPPHWLILWLPLDVVWKVLLVGHAIIAMSGAFACARLFGTRRPAALLAGITYACCGTVTGASAFSMEPAMVSIAWLPWQIALTRAALRAESGWGLPAVGLGVVTAFCVVGGHLPCLPIAAVMCGLYAILHLGWHARQRGLFSAGARAGRLCVAAGVAVGLSAAQLLPTLELLARSPRTGAFTSAQAADWFPLTPGELLLGLVNSLPNKFGFPSGLFVGTAALGLALIPIIDRRFRRGALSLWALGGVATLIALGTHTPVFGWYFHLQGSSIRLPQRFLMGSALSLALLSALGADSLCRARRTAAAFAALLLMTAVPLALVWAAHASPLSQGRGMSAALALTRTHVLWLAGMGALLLPPWSWCRRWLRPAVVLAGAGLVAYELYNSMELKIVIPATHPNALEVPTQAAAFIRRQGNLTRVVTPINPLPALAVHQAPVRLGLLENLQMISDYEPLVDRRFAELMWPLSTAWAGPGNAHLGPYTNEVTEKSLGLLRFLGVGFVVVAHGSGVAVRLPGPAYTDADVDVYTLPDPLPRAYVAAAVHTVSTPEQARAAVLDDTAWILQRGAVIEDGHGHVQGSEGSVVVRRYAAETVELEAHLSAPGLVVLQDRDDPYWRVTVDGVRVPIIRTNYVFRGVEVEAGTHTLRFAYHPTLVYAGMGVSLLTLLTLAAVAGARRRRWRPAPPPSRAQANALSTQPR